jgi:uncharacterized protein YkwD
MKRNAAMLLTVASLVGLSACGGGGGETVAPLATASVPQSGTVISGASTTVVSPYTIDALPPSTLDAADPRLAMFKALNLLRIGGGFGALEQSKELDQAATSHANYFLANYFVNGEVAPAAFITETGGWIKAHTESSGTPGFTGSLPVERIAQAGYASIRSDEVIAFSVGKTPGAEPDVTACLTSLVNSVFHRSSLLNTTYLDVGFGVSANAINVNGYKTKVCVIDFASKVAPSALPLDWTGVYPFGGSTDTPLVMVGEVPDPVPSVSIKGAPISIQVGFPNKLNIANFTVRESNGQPLAATILTSAQWPSYLLPNEAYLVPTGTLKANTTYQVSFTGTSNGLAINKNWAFTTASK